MASSPSQRDPLPRSVVADIAEALTNPDEVTSFLNVETGVVIPIFDDAVRDLDALLETLPESFGALAPADQRAAITDFIENSNSLWSEPEQIEEAFLVEQGRDTVFLEIPRLSSPDSYRIMEAFVATITSRQLRERLDDAMQGRGAFRRFKDGLQGDRDERERWFAFERASREERARAWLRAEGIEVSSA